MKLKLKSIDTITTKLLTLVLFITVIPLMAVANFSTGIINQSMFDSSRNELYLNANLAREVYNQELHGLKTSTIQAMKGYIEDSYFQYNKSGQTSSLKKNLKKFQKSSSLSSCLVITKNDKMISEEKLSHLGGNLLKLVKVAFSGDTVLSSEVLSGSDFGIAGNKFKTYLAQVVVVPIFRGHSVDAVMLVSRDIGNEKGILDTIKRTTDASLTLYKVVNKNSVSVITNTGFSAQAISADILSQLKSGNPVNASTNIDGKELGYYVPIKSYMGNVVGAMYVGIKESKFVEPLNETIKLIGIIAVISLIVAIILAALFARTITTPILRLVSAAKNIASGDLAHRVKIRGNDETAQLSNTFNQMAFNLQKQEQLRDNFVATLTHDLKVPMLAENQTINYLLKEAYGPVTEEQKEVLELIKSTNNSSLEMVSTLLEVYRYDTGNVKLLKMDFNLVNLVNECIEEIKSLAMDKKITISLESQDGEINVNADEREIKRVMHNLMSNAINNGIHRGHIVCSIEMIKEKNTYKPKQAVNLYTTLNKPIDISNSIIVKVKDDGIGISREDMPQLFNRFSLNKGRKPAGTGLGLYYSHQVITQHGGAIWAESSEGQGSTFIFKLPMNRGEE